MKKEVGATKPKDTTESESEEITNGTNALDSNSKSKQFVNLLFLVSQTTPPASPDEHFLNSSCVQQASRAD